MKNIKFLREKILSITALKFIFFVCFCIATIYSIIDFSNYFGALKNENDYSNFLNFSVKVIQNNIFFILILCLLFRFNYLMLIISFPLSFYEQQNNFFANTIHFFAKENIYFLISNDINNISPEYPRIFVFLAIIILYLFLFLLKKWRNHERVMLFLSGVAILSTAVLFHTAILFEIKFYKSHFNLTIYEASSNISNISEFNNFCKINKYQCYIFDKNQQDNVFIDQSIPKFINLQLSYLEQNYKKTDFFYYYGVGYDLTAKDRITGQIPFVLLKNKLFSVVLIDSLYYKNLLILNQFIFAILALASHLTWFFGILILISFHRYKKNKRISIS